MKILHIMRGKDKFTDGVAALYNENFNNSEHEICYLNNDRQSSCIRDNVSIPQHEVYSGNGIGGKIRGCIDIISLMKKYDYTVIHAFCLDIVTTTWLFLNRNFCRKHLVWIEWGVDLYDFKLKDNPSLPDKALFHIKKSVRSSVNSIIGIFPPDCNYFKEKFPKSNARVFYAPYMSSRARQRHYEYQPTTSRLKETRENKEPVYIQIGHNAQKQLNHLKALEVLSRFKDENIMLVLPLSYSAEQQYIEQINQYLENTFPGKYIVLKDFMPKEEYFKLVRRIDIAIFYTYRQTALGNIYEMINNNIKLFMPQGSVMKEYFCSVGIPVDSIESIENYTFQQFAAPVEWDKIPGPKNYIDSLNDYDARLQHWVDIYDELRKNHE